MLQELQHKPCDILIAAVGYDKPNISEMVESSELNAIQGILQLQQSSKKAKVQSEIQEGNYLEDSNDEDASRVVMSNTPGSDSTASLLSFIKPTVPNVTKRRTD